MRLISAELENYIGIYNGLGLYEISIDFTKCKNNIVIIKGLNGSGKSTIFKALTPMPDKNTAFIPGKRARKAIGYLDGTMKYIITYIHDVKADGTRHTTKSYIKSCDCSNSCFAETELNPSGNINDAREILYDLFKLDSNFIALSQLSSDDRGLADKLPSDRKKFINSIIDTLEVYNNIYKTLTKRASLFKSIMNSLNTKIDSLGDEDHIKATLVSLENRINVLWMAKDELVGNIAVGNDIVKKADPTGTVMDVYNKLMAESKMLQAKDAALEYNVKTIASLVKLPAITPELAEEAQKSIYNLIGKEQTVIDLYKSKNEMFLNKREEESKRLTEKTTKLDSLADSDNYKQVKRLLHEHKSTMAGIEQEFNKINFQHFDIMTKDEYILGLNTLKDIVDSISILTSDKEYHIIQTSITDYIFNDKRPDIASIDKIIKDTQDGVKTAETHYNDVLAEKKLSDKFDSIPSNCILIDECVFVKDIAKAKRNNPDKTLASVAMYITGLNKALDSLIKQREEDIKIIECIDCFKFILKQLDLYSNIIKKLPNNAVFIDKALFLQKLLDGYKFPEINELYKYIDYGNMLDTYKNSKNIASTLSIQYAEYSGRSALIEEISNDIKTLSDNINSTSILIEGNNKNIIASQNTLTSLFTSFNSYEKLIEEMTSYTTNNIELNKVITEINTMQDNITNIKNCVFAITQDTLKLNDININQLTPLIEDRDKLKHALKLLQEYCAELEEYNLKYEKVETIKFYSSPTTGIQTIFMEVYMNKIIHMANQLLTLLFNGEYVLQPFIINENEFRIPCSGNGLMNDDISSMSTSQICMISMILSFALLHHSSTKYNILKLDEIDGGLDTNNRIQFITLLDDIMTMLKCEQTIMISHNSELSLDNADIIILRDNDTSAITGNVIYRF